MAASQRALAQRGLRQESEILLRQIDAYLATVRALGEPGFVAHAERTAHALRQLVGDATLASAADRARVRAAVHYFVSRGVASGVVAARARTGAGRYALIPTLRHDRRPVRSAAGDDGVINGLLRELGRPDLEIGD